MANACVYNVQRISWNFHGFKLPNTHNFIKIPTQLERIDSTRFLGIIILNEINFWIKNGSMIWHWQHYRYPRWYRNDFSILNNKIIINNYTFSSMNVSSMQSVYGVSNSIKFSSSSLTLQMCFWRKNSAGPICFFLVRLIQIVALPHQIFP